MKPSPVPLVDGLRHYTRVLPPASYVLALLGAILTVSAPRFLTLGNLANVAQNAAILALAAFGQVVVVITGGLDLSSGSSVALVSVVSVLALKRTAVPIALASGAAAALAIGAVNGGLVAGFEMPAFLVTLGVLIGVHGMASLLVGGIPLEAPPAASFTWLGRGAVAGVPVPVLLATSGFIALALVLRWTVWGRSWYLIGANATAARQAGLQVRRMVFWAYVTGAAFVATAGLILTARISSGQPNLFPTLPFEAIAACAIGGVPLSGGAGSASQVALGVLILAVVENGLRLLNFSSDVQLMLIGTLTVLAVFAQTVRWPRAKRTRLGARNPAIAAVNTDPTHTAGVP